MRVLQSLFACTRANAKYTIPQTTGENIRWPRQSSRSAHRGTAQDTASQERQRLRREGTVGLRIGYAAVVGVGSERFGREKLANLRFVRMDALVHLLEGNDTTIGNTRRIYGLRSLVCLIVNVTV